jgi:uncharacterized membrane protein
MVTRRLAEQSEHFREEERRLELPDLSRWDSGRRLQRPGRRWTQQTTGTGWRMVARGLGLLSLALGVAELVAPEAVTRLIGVRRSHSRLVRLMGVREIAHAVAILLPHNPAPGMWSRIGGDAADLALLGAAFAPRRTGRNRPAMAMAAVGSVAVMDLLTAMQLTRSNGAAARRRAIRASHSVTINRPQEEVYNYWRDLQNLPTFMEHLVRVQPLGGNRTRWTAKAPGGMKLEWEAETVDERPNELIAWRSVQGAVENAGGVRFERAPGGRGTVVRVELEYYPPGGRLGAAVARLFGEEPSQQLHDDLRRFKQVVETGEVLRSEGRLRGPGLFSKQAARPPEPEKVRELEL